MPMFGRSIGLFLFLLLLACTTAAQAQSVGGSCSTVPSGSLASINSKLLICNGTTWALIEGFATSGNVGIGTTAPETLLHLNGANPTIRFKYNAGSNYNDIYADGNNSLNFGRNGATKVIFDYLGNVGIGITNPNVPLTVSGSNNQVNVTSSSNTWGLLITCLLYTSPSPRDRQKSRMPSS